MILRPRLTILTRARRAGIARVIKAEPVPAHAGTGEMHVFRSRALRPDAPSAHWLIVNW
jgi:hypothetical protein